MAQAMKQRVTNLFKRGGSSHPKETEGRIKLQRELFQFNKCVQHGFPAKPSALAVDPFLQLMAIGTRNGSIYVYGIPGVEFSVEHENDVCVNQLLFLPNQGRLVSVCNDGSLYLWEVNKRDGNSHLEQVRSLSMETGKQRQLSVCCVSRDGLRLLAGNEGGNVFLVALDAFSLLDPVIYQDTVMQHFSEETRLSLGAVECLEQRPLHDEQFLIGYSRGHLVVWDLVAMSVLHVYNAAQQLESACWHRDGSQFMSSHNDGSYMMWSVEESQPKEQATHPYGPFPCKPIGKLLWRTAKAEPLISFTGGMPRASYGDRNTVSLMQGINHQVLEFTSRVVDIHVLSNADGFQTAQEDEMPEHDEPNTLLCLLEEELVVIDLSADDWPVMRLPVLPCVHTAPITCTTHLSALPAAFYEKLQAAGRSQMQRCSERGWPLEGGKNLQDYSDNKEVLVTGHEDGSIRFWDTSSVCMSLLYTLRTAAVYGLQHQDNPDEQEDWPPFRKVGEFDPYSDDPRLGIQKLSVCVPSETLVAAGTAGQLLVMKFGTEATSYTLSSVNINIVNDRDGFVWKGYEPLSVTSAQLDFGAGFQPSCVLQLQPPAAVASVALHSEWQLLAAGTAHGFTLFDYLQKTAVHVQCTLKPSELSAVDETHISRRKSLKKSLRQSFRRLRRGRSKRDAAKKRSPSKGDSKLQEAGPSTSGAASAGTETEMRPVERQIEFRDDSTSSVIRCLQFADTFVLNSSVHSASLWVGTNGGHIFIYTITIPANNKRDSENVSCKIAKDIQLKHGAPVLSVAIVDRTSRLLPEPFEAVTDSRRAADYSGPQSVVIVSEEQIKVFELPKLRPVTKQKITAIEGARIRKIVFPSIVSRSDANYSETCVMCLSSLGSVHVYRVPSLRLQIQAQPISADDHIGVNSAVLTRSGQGFYLCSSTQFGRFSLSARHVTTPRALLPLDERPALLPTESARGDNATATVSEVLQDLDETVECSVENNLSTEITLDDIKVHSEQNVDDFEAETLQQQITVSHQPQAGSSAELTADDAAERCTDGSTDAAGAAGDAEDAAESVAQDGEGKGKPPAAESSAGEPIDGASSGAERLEELQIKENEEN